MKLVQWLEEVKAVVVAVALDKAGDKEISHTKEEAMDRVQGQTLLMDAVSKFRIDIIHLQNGLTLPLISKDRFTKPEIKVKGLEY